VAGAGAYCCSPIPTVYQPLCAWMTSFETGDLPSHVVTPAPSHGICEIGHATSDQGRGGNVRATLMRRRQWSAEARLNKVRILEIQTITDPTSVPMS
jgi:hypothetical protein